jgi:hypothetical protein
MTQQKPSSSLSPKSGSLLQEIARKAAEETYEAAGKMLSTSDPGLLNLYHGRFEAIFLRALHSVAQPLEEKLRLIGNLNHSLKQLKGVAIERNVAIRCLESAQARIKELEAER